MRQLIWIYIRIFGRILYSIWALEKKLEQIGSFAVLGDPV
jgi:hypothetical protein